MVGRFVKVEELIQDSIMIENYLESPFCLFPYFNKTKALIGSVRVGLSHEELPLDPNSN